MTLRLPDTGAEVLPDARRMVPSALRNAAPILEALQSLGLTGRLLELASGSGLHSAHMAEALGLIWQSSDVDLANFPSIRAWAAAAAGQILPPVLLDATKQGWSASVPPQDAVLLVNLLHLIPQAAAKVLLAELPLVLRPQGTACLYGPFLRDGQPTSDGDAAFDASLRAQDPAIGYKDLAWVQDTLTAAGFAVETRTMPANNLLLIARKTNSNN